ncbi:MULTISPECIES: DNA polymerase [Aeromonas]|uniref:DNA-directed DNA polymerase family A palm domain-containing protein n=4 Tax=Aeromonadaceae TaxID=84642 RepID=A0A5J6WYL4_9GAMM|nr:MULTISPECIES: DNA polymerase [Aeromonas]PNW65824.1 hypothetical protein C2U29_19675 [Aeromonas veronii]QFI55187.1 hypothetical protein FE240_11130 [Aeromonas simiae]TNH79014.1 hypothetical protein CF140_20580 [Aeromonas sobria]BBQ32670.1 hypothetical protein WP2W18E01_42520 [Aeromonas caviae]
MISYSSEFERGFAKKLNRNIIASNSTPSYLPRSNPSKLSQIPSTLSTNEIPFTYAKFNYQIHKKGVEWHPCFILPPINNAQGDHVVLDAIGRSKDFINMNTDDVFILQHNSKPFATTTGRNVIYGPSLTSLKKKFWPFVLNPITGYLYILLDYGQQEPAIAACFANDEKLQTAYKQGDLYSYVGQHPDLKNLTRAELKASVLPYSYGQRPEAYAKEHGIPLAEAQRRWSALREIFNRVDAELNHRSQLAFRDGYVRCRDWAAGVTPLSNPLAVRNWSVQATGADIMRRAVIGLVDAGIDLRLTIHDAFLIRVPIAEQDQQVAKAIAVLKQASSLVLDGFELNVKVDGVFDGQVGMM